MPTPFLVTGRIVLPYFHTPLTHVAHAYVKDLTLVGSDWKIRPRTSGSSDMLWTDAADGLSIAYAKQLLNTDTFGQALLQQLISNVWVTMDTHTVTGTPSAGAAEPAGQATLTIKDTVMRNFKVVIMESGIPTPAIWKTPPSTPTGLQQFVGYFIGTYGDEKAPYNWQVNQGDCYARAGGFVSLSGFLNRKVARARGV